MKLNSTALTLAAMSSLLLLSLSVTARDVTGIVFSKTAYGNIRAEVSLTPGEAGDDHVVYVSWDAEDRGPSLGDWPATNIVRIGNIAADATSVTALLPESAEKGRAFRAFLATPKRTGDFDSLIACIRSAGGAYIDTGCCLTTNSEVFFDFRVPEYEAMRTVTDYDLFGAMPMGTKISYRVYFTKGNWRWWYTCNKDGTHEVGRNTFGGDSTLAGSTRTAITLSPRTWTWRFQRASDGTDLSGTLYHVYGDDPSNLSLSLFATHTSSGFARVATNGVIYAASIKEGDAYVRKMQPAVRNGVAGLWDVVNDTFHASAGSRPFYATETDGVAFATVSFDAAFTDLIVPGETQVAASAVHGFSERKVTELSFRQRPGRDAVATAKLTPGAANDVDALYLAWGDRDYGEDMDAWPSSMRVCALSGSVTEHSFSVTNEMDGVTCFRAFLATAWHPDADKAIECVRSAGGAYIDTDFRCGAETRVMVDMQMPDCLKADAGAIYGMASTGTLYGVIFQKIKNNERYDYSFNKNGTTTWVGYFNCSAELRQRVEMSSIGHAFYLKFPAKTYNTGNQSVDRLRTNLPLFIFARSAYDGDGYAAGSIMPHGLLFGATIQEDGEYRRLFYPCVKGGVAGLCDFVENTFYPSLGLAAFLAADANGVSYPEAAFPGETVFTASPVAKAKAIRGTWLMVR